jgi:hypothetical protein
MGVAADRMSGPYPVYFDLIVRGRTGAYGGA